MKWIWDWSNQKVSIAFVAGSHSSRIWLSGSFESMWWNVCVHRLDLTLYSHPKEVLGNGVRTHVNSKVKTPSTRGSEEGQTWDTASPWTVNPSHYQLSCSDPYLPSTLVTWPAAQECPPLRRIPWLQPGRGSEDCEWRARPTHPDLAADGTAPGHSRSSAHARPLLFNMHIAGTWDGKTNIFLHLFC